MLGQRIHGAQLYHTAEVPPCCHLCTAAGAPAHEPGLCKGEETVHAC